MIKTILTYHKISFLRFKMSTFNAPPDFIAIVLSIGFMTILATAMAFENPLIFENIELFNFNYIVVFFYLGILFFDGYISKSYTPNFKYVRLLYPQKLKTQIYHNILFEILSFKIFFVIIFFISFIIFSYSYDISIFHKQNIKGVFLIGITYLNICIIVRLVKDSVRKKIQGYQNNFFKILFTLLFIVWVYNHNTKIISFNLYQTMVKVLYISFLLLITLLFTYSYTSYVSDRLKT